MYGKSVGKQGCRHYILQHITGKKVKPVLKCSYATHKPCDMFPDAVRELLTHIPASIKSEPAASQSHALSPDLAAESDLTPLHLAAFSGSEAVVRALLNSQGVQVEGGCSPSVCYCKTTHVSVPTFLYSFCQWGKAGEGTHTSDFLYVFMVVDTVFDPYGTTLCKTL
jgi:hypothetical protein